MLWLLKDCAANQNFIREPITSLVLRLLVPGVVDYRHTWDPCKLCGTQDAWNSGDMRFGWDPELLLTRRILPLSLRARLISLFSHPAVALESLALLILIIKTIWGINILRLRPQKYFSAWCGLQILAPISAFNRFLHQPLGPWAWIRLLIVRPYRFVWFSQRIHLRALIGQSMLAPRVICWGHIQVFPAWIWR